jgi:hypothetical protein
MESINIKVPISKSYMNTFINSFIPIHFYGDTRVSLENLKNLLFPIDYLDNEFNDLNNFIRIVFDEVIKNNRDINSLKKDLEKKVKYNIHKV